MTYNDFDEIVEDQLTTIKNMLVSKGKEYVDREKGERLANFIEAGKIAGITPAEALDGFLLKHKESYQRIVNNVKNNKVIDGRKFKEVFNDYLNYLILQKCVILDSGLVKNEEGSNCVIYNSSAIENKFKVGDIVYTDTHAVHIDTKENLSRRKGIVINNCNYPFNILVRLDGFIKPVGFSEFELSHTPITDYKNEI